MRIGLSWRRRCHVFSFGVGGQPRVANLHHRRICWVARWMGMSVLLGLHSQDLARPRCRPFQLFCGILCDACSREIPDHRHYLPCCARRVADSSRDQGVRVFVGHVFATHEVRGLVWLSAATYDRGCHYGQCRVRARERFTGVLRSTECRTALWVRHLNGQQSAMNLEQISKVLSSS